MEQTNNQLGSLLQYLVRKPNKPYYFNSIVLESAVLVLTKVTISSSRFTSGTLIEACVFDSIGSATNKFNSYLAKYEYLFTYNRVDIKQYYANEILVSAFSLPSGYNSELLNFTINGTNNQFLVYDNDYSLGVRLSNVALQSMLAMPSLGITTLSDEWQLP
jgi:hypothetical protein